MIIYLITLLLFLTFLVAALRKTEISLPFASKLESHKFVTNLLLIWIVFGFLTRLDFNQIFGCIIYFGEILDYNNIGFSLLSFVLIFAASVSKNKNTSTSLLIAEFLFWLFKYFYYKGGYATGITGSFPLDFIVFYDTVAIFLRLLILKNLNKPDLKILWVIIAVILLTSIKIFVFPVPHDLFWEEIKSKDNIEENTRLIKGSWKGTVQYDSTWVDTIGVYRLDSLTEEDKKRFDIGANRIDLDSIYKYCLNEKRKNVIDTIDVFIANDLTFKSRLLNSKIKLTYPYGGDLIEKKDSMIFLKDNFNIYKLDNDSLIIRMGYNHVFSLKR